MPLADALLVIQLQNGVCYSNGRTLDHLPELLVFVNQRIALYRADDKPIIFVQHSDSTLVPKSKFWQLHPILDFQPEDHYVEKSHANCFYQTDLFATIKKRGAQSLEFCGAQTEYGLDATIKFAHGLDFHNRVGQNSTTTFDNDFMTAAETIAFYETIWGEHFATVFST